MDKKEMKARKKAFKKAKRKAIRPWRFLTKFSLPFAIILIAATVITSMFDNTIALFVGGTLGYIWAKFFIRKFREISIRKYTPQK